jgi:hypothetical protein
VERVTGLSPCSGVNCDQAGTYEDCFGVVGCEWCTYDYNIGQSLSQPYCAHSTKCPSGAVGGPTLYPPTTEGNYAHLIRDTNTVQIVTKVTAETKLINCLIMTSTFLCCQA